MKVKVAWLNQIQGFLLAWIWWVWPNPSIFREMFSNPSIFEEIHILTLKNSRIWYFPSYFHATFTYRNASAQIFDQFDTLDHTVWIQLRFLMRFKSSTIFSIVISYLPSGVSVISFLLLTIKKWKNRFYSKAKQQKQVSVT